MEQQIAQYFLWSVYINATTLLIIVALVGVFGVQVSRALREITTLIRDTCNDDAGCGRDDARDFTPD